MQTGIADTGILRPLMLLDLLDHPTKEASAASDPVMPPRTLPVGIASANRTSSSAGKDKKASASSYERSELTSSRPPDNRRLR